MGGVHVSSQVGVFRVRRQFRISGLLWKLYVRLSIEDKDTINWLIIVPTDLLDFLRDQRQHANILHGPQIRVYLFVLNPLRMVIDLSLPYNHAFY